MAHTTDKNCTTLRNKIFTDEWGGIETFLNEDEKGRYYRDVGITMAKTGMRLYGDGNWGGEWVPVAEDRNHGDRAFYMKTEKMGKVFAVENTVNVSLATVFQKSWPEIETVAEWNPSCKEYKILIDYSDHTRLVYHVSQELFGGLLSSRDFVNVNAWRKIDGVYYLGGRSVEYDNMPPQKGKIRGENYIGWMRLEESKEHKDRTHICVMTGADFKGMLPRSLVERGTAHYLLDYIRHFKKYLENLEDK